MPRPNPTQTKNLDQVALRRQLKQMLPGDVALDREELRELLDLSNVGGRFDVLRLKLLRRALGSLTPDDVLRDDQLRALQDYHYGRGPRPSFALLVTADGHYRGDTLRNPDERRVEPNVLGPVEDPNEPGRYVQPSGRFARSEDKGFTPDPR